MEEEILKTDFERTPMAVIEWDLDFRVLRWNPAARAIFGYSTQEAVGQHASFIVPEKYRAHVDQVWESLLKMSGGTRSTNENLTKEGRVIQCEWYNTVLVDQRGTVTGVASHVMDFTERQQARQLLAWEKGALELISSEASLHEVLDGLALGLEEQVPGAMCSILLLDQDGVHLRHGAAPSLPDAYNRLVDGITIGPGVGSCGTAAHEDGQVIVADIASDPLWAEYRELADEHGLRACWSTPIHDGHGAILGTFAIYSNQPREPIAAELELIARATYIAGIAIERKLTEQAMRDSEEKYRTLFENAGDAILLMQGELFIDCNARTLAMFGCDSRDQIVGHRPHEFSTPFQPDGRNSNEAASEKIAGAMAGRRQFFEWMHQKLDGTLFLAEVSLITVEVRSGTLLQAVVRDISRRREAEKQIRELNAELELRVEQRTAELLAANKELEAFSYSVSHDLRAPLRAINGFSHLLSRNYTDQLDEEGREMLGFINSGARRMSHLIDDLLAFSRLGRQALEPSRIEMGVLAQEVFDEQAGLDSDRKLRLDLQALPPASGTESMIRQVWVNLISNAIKFTKNREIAEIEIGTVESAEDGTCYFVRDNGAGFDMENADRLFGVFQRLHSLDEFDGTGVGLALVQRIVQRHGGRVWAEGEVDKGATFYFTLPGIAEDSDLYPQRSNAKSQRSEI